MSRNKDSASIQSLCLNVTSGGTPSRQRDAYWTNGTIPWLKTGELKDNRIYDAEEKITEEGLAGSSAKIFPVNTVLMAMYGDGRTITSLGILGSELATNQACCAMIADPTKCDYQYLYYALMHHRHELLGLVIAGAQRNLSIGIIKRFEINTFPLDAQQRIASILSAYDDLTENNRRRIHLLEEAARLLYREWFVHLRFPGHERVSVIDGVPEGWERVSLGDVLMLQRGFDLPSQDRIPGEVPIYASTGVTGYHTQSKVAGPGVTTGRSGSLGTVLYIPCDFWPLNTTLWVKEFKKVPPIYASHLLAGLHLERYNGGAAVPTLNRNDAHKIEILQPVADLLAQFTQIAKPLYEQMRIIEQYNTKLAQARDLLLPRLMNGEIQL